MPIQSNSENINNAFLISIQSRILLTPGLHPWCGGIIYGATPWLLLQAGETIQKLWRAYTTIEKSHLPVFCEYFSVFKDISMLKKLKNSLGLLIFFFAVDVLA